ncbi:EexN family lipoprotein [Pigmentiphaga sp.]|uniref:EexN family lipoprotein n=1 Tax=Pigmentiphaga sp. TaxID=1977564 RepID=UPI0025E894BC|nr:EexN family lipoprotein [Pigmentiphaga sp.]
MKRIPIAAVAIAALTLIACGDKPSTDTVDSLIANPERLKELRAQCKADRAKLGDATCNAVGEATTRRFLGEGRERQSPYAPAPGSDAAKDTAP